MHVTVAMDPRAFLRCIVTGRADFQQAAYVLESFKGREGYPDCKWLLVDLLNVIGDLEFADRFNLGVATATQLKGFGRIAIVQAPRADNGFAALVARNRGTNVAVFDTTESAIDWLTGPDTGVF